MSRPTRTAIVTGGLSGMGLAIARRLARDGITVVIGARSARDVAHFAANGQIYHGCAVDHLIYRSG